MNAPIAIVFGRRTGTSSMAKALLEAGMPLIGPLDTRPFKSQPQAVGHYENYEARNADIFLMRVHNMRADIPGLMPFNCCEPLEQWFNQHPEPFLVKEPNVTMTWPVWLRTAQKVGRDLVGLWCRRPKEEQAASLVKRYHTHPENAKWCVEMYELCTEAASKFIPMKEVWLDDPERVDKAIAWFESHGIQRTDSDAEKERFTAFRRESCPA